ncbi:TonB-dependent receptor [Halarcobacter ebronensis]|uniref:TonB-dependent siderophore receptor n=1 Tax=Halarcobacter ebronensis TaxID=1462615 RepID=A0A4V1M0L9_9BACT|nr:TonB-dependent receptor [Halarcobacter ebronensis]QKF82733.1 TonB-dependent siderophore receptor [Halarcobacter ebronensis]RXK06758.1 TonB-dependent siderophore receptor [Halarcobacter ebronensis]
MFSKRIIYGSILISCALFGNENSVGEVTVTANKVEENIINVPQSITVIEKEELTEKNINSIPKIIDQIPNMHIAKEKAFGTTVNFRGLNTSMFTNNNPVVVYIDGVPVMDKYSYKAALTNVKRVEVLRGPQGTLYGKDAIGAVINIVTEDTPDNITGFVGVEYGSNNFMQTNFNISAPLVDNILYAGINGEFSKDDGWQTNTYLNDNKSEKSENKDINAYFKYLPTDRLSMKFNITHSETDDNGINGNVFTSTNIKDIKRSGAETVSMDIPTTEKIESDSLSLALEYNLDYFDLNFVSTYRDSDLNGIYDSDYLDGTKPDAGLTQWNSTDTKTYTNELRVSNYDNFIKWVGGLYFDSQKVVQSPYGYDSVSGGAVYHGNADSTTKSKTYALFGQTMIPLTEKLELTLGGRYQKIKKDFYVDVLNTWGGFTLSDFTIDTEKTWNVFLPKVAMSYKIDEDLASFLSISKGYMPGGFNYFPSSPNINDAMFKPQESINYEMGVKGAFKDFNFAASLFYMDISDIHIYKSDGMNWFTDNAKKAHSYGLELEGKYFLSDVFDISGSLGLIKSEYDDYDAGGGVKFDGQDIENIPSHTLNLSLNYNGNSGIYGYVNVVNRGNINFYDNNNKRFLEDDGNTTINIKIGKKFSNWDIYAYVDNITDEDYVTSYMSKSGLAIALFNEPRFFGIGARYSF